MDVAQARASCQLYVVVEAGPTAAERLSAAIAATDVACVLIVPGAGAALDKAAARELVDIAQRAGAAALIAGDAALARTLRADGVHLGSAKGLAQAYAAARELLGPSAVIGADPGISRDDAMTLAEAGADYIAFAAPAHLTDRAKARVRRDDLVAWWAEIFQAPCVAFDVETPQEAEALSRAGADFIAVALASSQPPAAARDLVAGIVAAIDIAESAE